MSLLSDKERTKAYEDAMQQSLRSQDQEGVLLVARAIESAILEKLKAQEPVAYVVNAEVRWNTDKAPSFAALYFNPIPADDVVRQRDELLAAAEAIEINAEECLDFDECTAMLVPIDDYHKLVEAIASVKGETK